MKDSILKKFDSKFLSTQNFFFTHIPNKLLEKKNIGKLVLHIELAMSLISPYVKWPELYIVMEIYKK